MAFLKKGVPLKGVRKIVATNEAVRKGRVQFIHRLLDHVRNLSLYPKSSGQPKRLLSRGETWLDLPFKRSLRASGSGTEQIGVGQGGQPASHQLQQCELETMVVWTGEGFLSLGTIDVLGQIILFVWGYPLHCRILNSIPGLYTLDAGNIASIQLWPP